MLELKPRAEASTFWTYASPVLALALTVLIGLTIFVALGKDPVQGLLVFFWEPIKSTYAIGELLVKATPLLLIALGLAVCFRSNVWNIGAEGQYVVGAIAAGGIALTANADSTGWIVVSILLAGTAGGMVWAGLVAWLRDRFNANEILVSLMLVYVAIMVLGYLVYGPWKDPLGYNFPQTKTFETATQIPRLFKGSRVNIGLVLALLGVIVMWVFLFRTRAGWAQQIGGLAPQAARYAGFSSRRAIWLALLVSGGAAGLAGALYAFSKGSISPESMSVGKSVDGLVMVLLGGIQTLAGPVVGAFSFTWLHDVVARNTDYWRAMLGSVILLLVLLFPQGISGSAQMLWLRWRGKPAPSTGTAP